MIQKDSFAGVYLKTETDSVGKISIIMIMNCTFTIKNTIFNVKLPQSIRYAAIIVRRIINMH